jgi:hypothetical protein
MQNPDVQSVFATQFFPLLHEPHVPPQSTSVSVPLSKTLFVHGLTTHLPITHEFDVQSLLPKQVLFNAHGLQSPPQSTSASVMSFTPLLHL